MPAASEMMNTSRTLEYLESFRFDVASKITEINTKKVCLRILFTHAIWKTCNNVCCIPNHSIYNADLIAQICSIENATCLALLAKCFAFHCEFVDSRKKEGKTTAQTFSK